MKVDHIGYLVADINKSIELFRQFGYIQETRVYTDSIQDEENLARNVYICFLKNENTRIELVSPINEKSDVYSSLKRQGEGPYHICYQVNNLENIISELVGSHNGYLVLKKPKEAIAFNNAKVAFLYKKGVGMIEFVEKNEEI